MPPVALIMQNFLLKKIRSRQGGAWLLALTYIILGSVLRLGGFMGLYQIARGEHFLSHTLATLGLAWLLSVLLALAIKPTQTAA